MRKFWGMLLAVVLLLSGCAALPAENQPLPTLMPAQEPLAGLPEATDAPRESTQICISAAGDCTLGGDVLGGNVRLFDAKAQAKGLDYFFSGVHDIFAMDDLTFVNLEGPLTTGSDYRPNRQFIMRGKPEYAQILAEGEVDVVTVINNHAMDCGDAGRADTRAALDAAGVGYCGYGAAYTQEIRGVTVTCLGFAEWYDPLDDVVAQIEAAREHCDILICYFHWGEERILEPTANMTRYAYAAVDAGADLVLGAHSHVIGSIEQYQGKHIVYSLANFCFGGNRNPSDKDTFIFQQVFEVTEEGVADGGIRLIPCSVSSSKGTNDYRPRPVSGADAKRILERIARYSVGIDKVFE